MHKACPLLLFVFGLALAGEDAPPPFEALLASGRLVSAARAAEALGGDASLSRDLSRDYRARAAACLGRETAGGTFEWEAPTLAGHPLRAEAGRKAPEPPADPGKEGKLERRARRKAEAEVYLTSGKVKALVQLPEGYDPARKYPLILWLHGSWTDIEKGSKAFRKGMQEVPAIRVAIDSSRAKIDGAGWNTLPEMGTVLTVLRQVRLRYAVDAARIQLWGHSNGAGGCIRMTSLHPGVFAATAAFSCVLQAGMPAPSLLTENLRGKPVHLWQGAEDANATSLVDRGRAFEAWLKGKGGDVSYEEEPGEDHLPSPEAVRRAWDRIGQAILPRNPRTVSFQGVCSRTARGSGDPPAGIRQAMAGRCHWLEASRLEMPEGPKGDPALYEVSGRIEGNAIALHAVRVRAVRLHLNDALLDLDQEITVTVDGQEKFRGKLSRSLATLAADILETASPEEAADAVLEIGLEQ